MASRLSRLLRGETKIGFVGLGKMGYGMASNLCSTYQLLVHDLDDNQSSALRCNHPQHVEIASSASQVAAESDVLISVLPNDRILRDVVENDILHHLHPHSLHVSCSTISPDTASHLSDLHSAHNGSHYIASPIFARPDGMAAGNAIFPISGATQVRLFR